MSWDAGAYLRFANERTQPSIDLIERIRLTHPRRIIDLGCGPGNSTEPLRQRWPEADVIGLDSSAPMIEAARKAYPTGTWLMGDAATWTAEQPFDLVFSNAMLQWLPDHTRICRQWFDQVAPGGALAVQIPAHYDLSMNREIVEVSKDAAWSGRLQGGARMRFGTGSRRRYTMTRSNRWPLTSTSGKPSIITFYRDHKRCLSGSAAPACDRIWKLYRQTRSASASKRCCSKGTTRCTRAVLADRSYFRFAGFSLCVPIHSVLRSRCGAGRPLSRTPGPAFPSSEREGRLQRRQPQSRGTAPLDSPH